MTKNKTLLLLGLALLFSACGKDNSVGGSGSGVGGPIGSSPITTTVAGATELGAKIDNYTTYFGYQQVYYGPYMYSYQYILSSGVDLAYRYTKSTSSANGSGCEKKWSIFYVCSYSSTSNSYSVSESRKVFNNSVDIVSKQNELKALINDQNPLIPIYTSYTSYMLTTKSGKQYAIDLRYPLQANPIGIKDSSGTEYLYNITEN